MTIEFRQATPTRDYTHTPRPNHHKPDGSHDPHKHIPPKFDGGETQRIPTVIIINEVQQ